MNSPNYVWEKMYVAISCLCGEGSFATRWENARVSALMRLNDDDLVVPLGDDLKYILSWTRADTDTAESQSPRQPDEIEKKRLIEKMLHVLLETHEKD